MRRRLRFGLLAVLVLPAGFAGSRTVRAEDPPAATPGGAPGGVPGEAPGGARDRRLDEVVLTSGRSFEGRIASEDATKVVLTLPSETGCGTITFPRDTIREIRRGTDRTPIRSAAGVVRDTWFLLESGGRIVGTRRLLLRKARQGSRPLGASADTPPDGAAWELEEQLVHFARGRHVPETRVMRTERVDLAFLPLWVDYREIGDASSEPGGTPRYERRYSGAVHDGSWTPAPDDPPVLVPAGTRGRLGTREHLLRRREAGMAALAFLEPAERRIATVRAGYTALDQPVAADGASGRADEFVWEEGDRRLVWALDAEGRVLREEIAEGVFARPATAAQVEAAKQETEAANAPPPVDDPTLPPTERRPPERTRETVALAEVGLSFQVPGPAWKLERALASSSDVGSRVVARLSTQATVSDVRVEWDPDGALAAPGAAEAEARLLQRLRVVCPDLSVTDVRRPAGPPGAWRLGLRGTLKGESVRTIAVVIDRGAARILVLCACPEVSWGTGQPALESFVASLKVL